MAEELDISSPTLYEMMEKLGIKKDKGQSRAWGVGCSGLGVEAIRF